jgi:hypothetical protein
MTKDFDIPDFDRIPATQSTPEIRQMNSMPGVLFLNPELPKDVQEKIQATPSHDLSHPAKPVSLTLSASLVQAVLNPVTMGGAGVAIAAGVLEEQGPAAGGAILGLIAISYVKARIEAGRRFRSGEYAAKGYICTEWMRSDYAKLAKGVKNCVDSIMAAEVVQNDKVDKALLEIRLPQILWDITHTVFEVSVLRTSLEEASVDDRGKKYPISKAQDAALRSVLQKMLDRHNALKRCARRIEEADEQYRALRALEKTEGFDSRIFDLLSRTATQDAELAGIQALSSQAVAVTEAYREAVNTALDSINTALELEK